MGARLTHGEVNEMWNHTSYDGMPRVALPYRAPGGPYRADVQSHVEKRSNAEDRWPPAAGSSSLASTRPPTHAAHGASDAVASIRNGASDMLLVDPGGDAPWRWPIDVITAVTGAITRGRRTRILFGRWPSAPSARQLASHAAAAGAEVRTGGTPDQAVLATEHNVLLPSDTALTAVAAPQLVRLVRDFAELAWSHGTPANIAENRDVETAHRSLQQRIVQLLADGAKDETIARVMGMSVRTCRRHIADIMRRLDAVSRFQAGANAVRSGLMGIEPSPRRSM